MVCIEVPHLAARLKTPQRLSPDAQRQRGVLLGKLGEFSRTGRTTIEGRAFSPRSIEELQIFLTCLSIRPGELGAILDYDSERRSSEFVVGTKAHTFLLNRTTMVIVLADCQTNAATVTPGVQMNIEMTGALISSSVLFVFAEGVQSELRKPVNQSEEIIRATMEPNTAFNLFVFDMLLGDYITSKLMASSTRVDADTIKRYAPLALSTDPRMAYAKALADVEPEEKHRILRVLQIENESQLADYPTLSLKVYGNELLAAKLQEGKHPPLQELIQLQEVLLLGIGVFGSHFKGIDMGIVERRG